MMKARHTLMCALLLLACRTSAETINADSINKAKKHEAVVLKPCQVSLQVGLNVGNNCSVGYEAGFSWFPLRYAGVGLAAEIDDNKGDKPLLSSDKYDNYTYDHNRIIRFNLHPSLAFRAPLLHLRKTGALLMLQCNPGLVVSMPKNDTERIYPPFDNNIGGNPEARALLLKNRDGKWLAWRMRTALTLYGDTWALSLG